MRTTIGKQAKAELLAALRERYLQAPKLDKTKVLDEFVAVAGCHRKHAIRLLTTPHPAAPGTLRVARQIYGEAVREALVVLWEAADWMCGKRPSTRWIPLACTRIPINAIDATGKMSRCNSLGLFASIS